MCCGEGKIKLSLLAQPPEELKRLLEGTNARSKKFRKNIRTYNNMFAFTSLGGKIDSEINSRSGPYVFRLNGLTYHCMGSLLPAKGVKLVYAQLYMYDVVDDLMGRLNFPNYEEEIDTKIVHDLTQMLDRENALVKIFRSACERFRDTDYMPVKLRLVSNRNTDGRDNSLPTNAFEFTGLIPGDDLVNPKDIILEYRSSKLIRIFDLHLSYVALQYPLLFPFGEDGFRLNILHRGLPYAIPNKMNKVTMREYYAFRLQHRRTEGKTLLQGGHLFLQHVVDAWSSVEHDRLSFVLKNQARSDVYNNVVYCVSRGDTDATKAGKLIILPAKFTGGPRYM